MRDRYILTPYFLDEPLAQLETLVKPDWQVNKPDLEAGESIARMSAIYQALAGHVAYSLQCGQRPISLAGDCCTAIGVLAGLQQANLDPVLVWFDAHGDFNTWQTTPSGFLGGMPLAMIVGRGEQTLVEAVDLTVLPEERIILTDGRDLDPDEAQAIQRSNLHHLDNVSDLLEYSLPEGPIYVHFDVDVLDPADAPAVSYPASGGPTLVALQQVFQFLADTQRIAAVSLSSWNPALDGDGATQAVSLDLMRILIESA